MNTDALPLAVARRTVPIVWIVAVVASVLIGLFSDASHDGSWFGIALAGSVFLALCVQLATQQKEGFVRRLGASVAGAVLILAVASGIIALLR